MSRMRTLTVDCRDPYALAGFWSQALSLVEDPTNPNALEDDEAYLVDPAGTSPALLFIRVPERKIIKNRLHLDLEPATTRDEEVAWLLALGATLVDDRRRPDGTGWQVLADPEGNELCVERTPVEGGEPAAVDTGERPMPKVGAAGERETLQGLLGWYREGVTRKLDGISQQVAAASPVRSGTSIAGVVKHLAVVEDAWFTCRLAEGPDPWAHVDWEADQDWEWRTAREEPIAQTLQVYHQACARSHAVAAGRQLDTVIRSSNGRDLSLRWVMTHMLEETARHLGHLDILRELMDGTTGE